MQKPHFIIVPGQTTSKFPELVEKSQWKSILENEFPGSSVSVFYSNYFMVKDAESVANAAESLKKEIENIPGPIILFGYCCGGFISRLAYNKLSAQDQVRIQALVTMATPHQVPSLPQRRFLESLGYDRRQELLIPTMVFASWFDPYSFPLFVRPQGKMVKIKNFIFALHTSFFFNKRVQRKVVQEMKNFLGKL